MDVVDEILQALSELVGGIENILTTAKEHISGEPHIHMFSKCSLYVI